MGKPIIIFIIFITPWVIFSQSGKEYHPILYEGSIPEEFLFDPFEVTQEQLKNESRLSREEAEKFYSDINFLKKQLFLSSNIYFNDVLTDYVKTVAKNTFKNNPSILNKINIYVTKSPVPNAVSLPDGTILINLGLLSVLENEAQLAFILAHEVIHIEKEHVIETILKTKAIKESEVNNYNPLGDLFRKLSYSRDYENTSDAKGLEHISVSMYDAFECPNALARLHDSIFLKFNSPIDYSLILNEKLQKDTSLFEINSYKSYNENKFSLNWDYDDLFSSHPDLEKRIAALKEILSITSYSNTNKAKNTFTEDYIKNIREISLFELANNQFEKSDYGLSLYISLHLSNTFPDNIFLKTLILKNLYWLSYYKEINSLKNVLNRHEYITHKDYQEFCSLFENISVKDLKDLTYRLAKDKLDTYKEYEDFYFYFCKVSESFLGEDAANLLYRQFQNMHPSSKYHNYVENRLK